MRTWWLNQPPTMSYKYNKAVACEPTKQASRAKIASSMKQTINQDYVIHHLGGRDRSIPFEKQFDGLPVKFVRYEKLACNVPQGYQLSFFTDDGKFHTTEKKNSIGFFSRGNFFETYFDYAEMFKGLSQKVWLDFCGMPYDELVEMIYYSFFYEEFTKDIDEIYFTFFLNHRGHKEARKIMGDGNMIDKATSICNHLKMKFDTEKLGLNCEVFDTYLNDRAPMCVIKISRKRKEVE
jgi:hypothetical protein